MDFDLGNTAKKAGKVIGFLTFYFIFTTVLFFMLRFLGRIDHNFNYLMMMNITLFIVLIGTLLRLSLK